MARTDSLILGWDEAMYRAKEFARIGADGIFIEALPDRDAMRRAVEEVKMPMLANSESFTLAASTTGNLTVPSH